VFLCFGTFGEDRLKSAIEICDPALLVVKKKRQVESRWAADKKLRHDISITVKSRSHCGESVERK